MPKPPRKNHIPAQPPRRRPRRQTPAAQSVSSEESDGLLEIPGTQAPAAPIVREPERIVRQTPRAVSANRVVALPTYDRAYLIDELRRIGLLTGSLLLLIIVLTVLLR